MDAPEPMYQKAYEIACAAVKYDLSEELKPQSVAQLLAEVQSFLCSDECEQSITAQYLLRRITAALDLTPNRLEFAGRLLKTTGSRVLTQAEVLLAKEEAYAKLRADNKALLDENARLKHGGRQLERLLRIKKEVETLIEEREALAEHSEPQ